MVAERCQSQSLRFAGSPLALVQLEEQGLEETCLLLALPHLVLATVALQHARTQRPTFRILDQVLTEDP
jgi:hypothetical protein